MTKHLEVWEMEKSWDTPADKAWDVYCDACERLLKISNLDGNETTDGYSLDSAYDAWKAGIPAAEYAQGKRA
jgi:hypothetical protein